jgi:hypothetical protein
MPNLTIETLKTFIEWLYKLLYPKTHNRIALATVIAGIGLAASPVWEPFARALLEKIFFIKIDPPTSPIFGIVLVGLGLLYHYGTAKIEAGKTDLKNNREHKRALQIVTHDLNLANQFRKILSDDKKDSFIHRIEANHACMNTDVNQIEDSVQFLSKPETYFLDESLRKKSTEYVTATNKLLNFISLKFFVYPREAIGEKYQFAMQPSLNIDREGEGREGDFEKYDALTDDLYELTKKVSEKYDELIKLFHEKLLG